MPHAPPRLGAEKSAYYTLEHIFVILFAITILALLYAGYAGILQTSITAYVICVIAGFLCLWVIYMLRKKTESEILYIEIEKRIAEKELLEKKVQEYVENVRMAHNRALKAADAAQKADAAKSEFLANMSHELRTPMNSILGMTRLLLDEKNIKGESYEMLKIIQKSGENLLEILNDILDLSKIEEGGLELEKIPFIPHETAFHIIETLTPLAHEKGLSLIYANNNHDIVVVGDPLRFGRIITNLVGNAIKYTSKGSINLELVIEEISSNSIILKGSVTDTGIGISADKLDYIFEKFTQADTSTTRRFGGTGLGLAITKHLTSLMSGTMAVKSDVGIGSVFSFQIPFLIANDKSLPQHANARLDGGESRKLNLIAPHNCSILIAEDHPMNQILVKKLLKKMGLEKFTLVDDGKAALTALERNSYDVIFMDCHMPNMNGYDAAVAIRSRDIKTPIIAMTANAMVGDREHCLECGMDEYVSKPIDFDTLRQVLRQWIDV